MKQEVKSFDDKVLKEISLDKSIFGLEPKETIIHRMIRYQLSKKRSGNHKTKGISEISGTTKKPFKQKGTGNARQGSRRSPQNERWCSYFWSTGKITFSQVTKKNQISSFKNGFI